MFSRIANQRIQVDAFGGLTVALVFPIHASAASFAVMLVVPTLPALSPTAQLAIAAVTFRGARAATATATVAIRVPLCGRVHRREVCILNPLDRVLKLHHFSKPSRYSWMPSIAVVPQQGHLPSARSC